MVAGGAVFGQEDGSCCPDGAPQQQSKGERRREMRHKEKELEGRDKANLSAFPKEREEKADR